MSTAIITIVDHSLAVELLRKAVDADTDDESED